MLAENLLISGYSALEIIANSTRFRGSLFLLETRSFDVQEYISKARHFVEPLRYVLVFILFNKETYYSSWTH